MTKGQCMELISEDSAIHRFANGLSSDAEKMCAAMGMSKWDLCVALANACGHILADAAHPGLGKGLPRDKALERMDALREVMQGAYDLRDVAGKR